MKKIPFIIILIVTVTAILLPVAAEASGLSRQIAQVTMPAEYRPPNAVDISGIASGSGAARTGNVILQLIAGSLIYAAGPVAVLMIAVGGFRYVIAHGEQAQIEEAKKNIMWAVIGLLVIIVSWAIVENVINISTSPGAAVEAQTGTESSAEGDATEDVGAPDPGGEAPEAL